YFFFFQAEDGIRDDLVTGVQTCALPIFQLLQLVPGPRLVRGQRPGRSVEVEVVVLLLDLAGHAQGQHELPLLAGIADQPRRHHRSEERRVGKEWRSGWSQWPYKQRR